MTAHPRTSPVTVLVEDLGGETVLVEHGLCVRAESAVGVHCGGRQEEEHADCDLD
jgi:hypothetical protein